ncbi:motility associated factor glycosyltransferase family protein [Paenibacillus luteus]|uniref:motility associated factor glycosyltransferase family protein n=1 Tax=Paenibacillus luteus TaxID=2545753 RepID=UPI0011420E42|nr:6-hydroxymethylpterin diphosphokinase MptE-like protein [Paenibacillus luteus]
MIGIENQTLLKKEYPTILNDLNNIGAQELSLVSLVDTKNGLKTMEVKKNNTILLHSKYNPMLEVEKLYEDIREEIYSYEHIVFFGIGLGYHIDYLVCNYPNITFSIYEPSAEIFYRFLEQRSLKDIIRDSSKTINVGNNDLLLDPFINDIIENHDKIHYFVLPSYERIFEKELTDFQMKVRDFYQLKVVNTAAYMAYEKRWTINNLVNLKTTLQTSNFLQDYKEIFLKKPVIIVSAGPSLDEELINLHYIKKNNLAYIFAVGSAIKTLIKNKIIPNGVFTYDPKGTNELVFQELHLSDIDSIPMIYGTNVGYETIKKYRGPKVHFFTEHDKFSTYFMERQRNETFEYVRDNLSIAIVAYNLLAELDCSLIILVGQNLAYRNKEFHAQDIIYGDVRKTIDSEQTLIEIKSTEGSTVYTNLMLNQMRIQLEYMIKAYPNINTINTTKQGAKIEGTVEESLNEVINKYLKSKIVQENWYKGTKNKYSKSIYNKSLKNVSESHYYSIAIIQNLNYVLDKLYKQLSQRDSIELDQIKKMIIIYNELINQSFYIDFISPMLRTQVYYLNKYENRINNKSITQMEIENLIYKMREFIKDGTELSSSVHSYLREIKKQIEEENENFIEYKANDGVFNYVGDWNVNSYLSNIWGTIHRELRVCVSTNSCNRIEFSFFGKKIRIVGGISQHTTKRIKINIDSNENIINIPDFKTLLNGEIIFEAELSEELHTILIETIDNDVFFFEGIQIE